jgi:iron complex transport system substrate-binding protein
MSSPGRLNVVAISVLLLMLNCTSVVDAATGAVSARPKPVSTAEAARSRITVVDDFGHRVTVSYPPRRIVSLAPGPTAMLLAAGAGSQLVATIEYSGQPAFERRLPKIGSASAIDMERLIAARPDVVIVWPDGNNPVQIANIERLGFPVYRQETITLDGLGGSLRRLGRLAGTSAVADRAASALEEKLAILRREYGNVKRPLHRGRQGADERRAAGLRGA